MTVSKVYPKLIPSARAVMTSSPSFGTVRIRFTASARVTGAMPVPVGTAIVPILHVTGRDK